MGPGQIDELWILNLREGVAIIDAMYRSDTPDEVIGELRTIAESAEFAWWPSVTWAVRQGCPAPS